MKIVILGPAHPYRGGIAAFGERLAVQLQREGHSVVLYTFTLQYPSFLFPGKTQYSDEPAPEGLEIRRRVNSCNPFNWVSVGREIAAMKADLMITGFWLPFMSPCFGTIARIVRRAGTRCVAILHNLIPHEHHFFDRPLVSYFTGSQDAFVALSRSVLTGIDSFDRSKPRVFSPHPLYDHYGEHLGKEQARQLLGIDVEAHYVLFFGFIRDYKGLDMLLDAFADRRLRDMNVRLIVAGEFYGDPKPYTDQIERLAIADRIELRTDFIPDSEVNRYFCASDVLILPYRTATQSGVTQIAFHFERPMIVTRVGGLPEIVADGEIGYVAEPTAASLADAMVRYYSEGKEAYFVDNLREEKKKYAWDIMTAAICDCAARCAH